MTKHTPTPWSVDGIGTNIIGPKEDRRYIAETCTLMDDNGHTHNDDHSKEDAAYIVRAVNSHEELLQALKDLANEICLGKLSVRKDFSLINAHASALKAIFKAEGK